MIHRDRVPNKATLGLFNDGRFLFRRQVEHFFRVYDTKLWGKEVESQYAIAAFHRAAQIREPRRYASSHSGRALPARSPQSLGSPMNTVVAPVAVSNTSSVSRRLFAQALASRGRVLDPPSATVARI